MPRIRGRHAGTVLSIQTKNLQCMMGAELPFLSCRATHALTIAERHKKHSAHIDGQASLLRCCNILSQVREVGGIRLCLLAAPLVFSKLPCLLGTSTQTDAVLSALGNSRGLWVFTERPTRTKHTHSVAIGATQSLRANTHTADEKTWENTFVC